MSPQLKRTIFSVLVDGAQDPVAGGRRADDHRTQDGAVAATGAAARTAGDSAQVAPGGTERGTDARGERVDRSRAGVPDRGRHPARPPVVPAGVEVAAAKACVPGVGVHTLRHSAKTAWLDSGVHIKQVADLLGHSSISITGDIYGHGSQDGARRAVESLIPPSEFEQPVWVT